LLPFCYRISAGGGHSVHVMPETAGPLKSPEMDAGESKSNPWPPLGSGGSLGILDVPLPHITANFATSVTDLSLRCAAMQMACGRAFPAFLSAPGRTHARCLRGCLLA